MREARVARLAPDAGDPARRALVDAIWDAYDAEVRGMRPYAAPTAPQSGDNISHYRQSVPRKNIHLFFV